MMMSFLLCCIIDRERQGLHLFSFCVAIIADLSSVSARLAVQKGDQLKVG